MAKAFLGMRLRTLREQRGMTQSALAAALGLSPSYVNQLESNQRPLSVPVLLRLQERLGIDLQLFSQDAEATLVARLREATAGMAAADVPLAELRSVAQQLPAVADVLIRLQRRCRSAEARVDSLAAGRDVDRLGGDGADGEAGTLPHEEVRESFYARHRDMVTLDEAAERLHDRLVGEHGDASTGVVNGGLARKADDGSSAAPGGKSGDGSSEATEPPSGRWLGPSERLAARLEQHLAREFGVRTVAVPQDPASQVIRRYDPATRTLSLAGPLAAGQRAFQIAIQAGLLAAGELIDACVEARSLSTDEARSLARIGFANHYAGALLLPHRRFLADAEALRYDLDLLAERHDVSIETICHRLSTMQREPARTIPFFFVRVDRAGNISKRQSATDFHFARGGGTCPLWNVYEAFAQPGKVPCC